MSSDTITIILSNDGSKYQIKNMKMTATLNDLKQRITKDKSLTRNWGAPVDPQSQRLFYFGRELKSGNRSLEALMGSFHSVFPKIMHLHSRQPKVKNIQLDKDLSDENHNGCIDDDDDDDVLEVIENVDAHNPLARSSTAIPKGGGTGLSSSTTMTRRKANQVVVDLLDDSDSDDDDVVVIEEPVSKKPRGC